MFKTRILASALLAAAAFGTMSPANAVVPGSDTADRAADSAAVQSVIEGSAPASRGAPAEGEASYGFPLRATATANGALVPGSRTAEDAADRAAVTSVVDGIPGASYTAAPGGIGSIVPGSDSF